MSHCSLKSLSQFSGTNNTHHFTVKELKTLKKMVNILSLGQAQN